MSSKESMRDQASQIWSFLDDMARNDPDAYKRFIDKQMKERKEAMAPPEPHMCVSTMSEVNFSVSFSARLKKLYKRFMFV